jgi:hypothetical protein
MTDRQLAAPRSQDPHQALRRAVARAIARRRLARDRREAAVAAAARLRDQESHVLKAFLGTDR